MALTRRHHHGAPVALWLWHAKLSRGALTLRRCVGAWRLGTGVTTGERQGARCRQPLLVRASGAEGGADSIKQKVAWSTATLIDNRPVNAESNLRALSLSVTDAVRRLEGRNFNG